ncbi:hypothetical protein, partial [Accumulibacter sp.]|uniref:hypothetical protein n=1 Tax=Accumulibacter sp. TaxID=2053492 RepID=UPI002879403A
AMDGFRFRPQTTTSGMAKEGARFAVNPPGLFHCPPAKATRGRPPKASVCSGEQRPSGEEKALVKRDDPESAEETRQKQTIAGMHFANRFRVIIMVYR